MKDYYIAEAHVDVSDSMIFTGKKWHKTSSKYRLELPESFQLTSQFDWKRMKASGVRLLTGAICALDFDKKTGKAVKPRFPLQEVLRHLSLYKQIIDEVSPDLEMIQGKEDLDGAENDFVYRILLHIEGIYFVEELADLDLIDLLYEMGVRSIGPMWNLPNKLGSSRRLNKTSRGLSSMGLEFVHKMNSLNMVIDLAHASNSTIEDIVAASSQPVMFSHGHLEAFTNDGGMREKDIKNMINSGGFLGFSFLKKPYTYGDKEPIENLASQIKETVDKYGEDNVGIGSDFDGMSNPNLMPKLEDASKYSNLVRELEGQGLNQSQISKVMGLNYLGFLRRVLA